ncbi:MAG: nucleotidyl transferase AbiEii/AbiGii toxin family protein [Leptospirales bacterium]
MPSSTIHLWDLLSGDPHLRGFFLIGDTALSLRIGHRISEDLVFVVLEDILPGKRLDLVLSNLRKEGLSVLELPDIATQQDFDDSGLNLSDYQRNYVVDRVKVSFFTPLQGMKDLFRINEISPSAFPVIPDLKTLVGLKCLACGHRSKSRDWLDLYLLMREHGFGIEDMREVFKKCDPYNWDSAIRRLTTMKVSGMDEGCIHLMEDPPGLDWRPPRSRRGGMRSP